MNYYISNDGNDSNPGADPTLAWASLSKLYAAFESGKFAGGDRILFRRGDKWKPQKRGGYVRVRNIYNASSGNPLHIGAYGVGKRPSIDGEGKFDDRIFVCNGSEDDYTAHVRVSDIEVAGNLSTHVHLTDCVDWQFVNCLVRGRGIGVGFVGSCEDIIFESCEVDGGGEGLYIGTSDGSDSPRRIRVLRCLVHGGTNDGIDFKPGCWNCEASYNVVYNRQQNGISTRGQNIRVVGNEIYDCANYGIAQFDKVGAGVSIIGNHIRGITGQTPTGISTTGDETYVIGNVIDGCDRGVFVSRNSARVRQNRFVNCDRAIVVRDGARVVEDFNEEV